jgi:protein SCO1/2
MAIKLRTAGRRRQRDRRALTAATGLVAALLLLASGLLWLSGPGTRRQDEQAAIGGPFTLVSDTGKIVTDRSFPGKYLLIYFGYTACRDVCPMTLNGVAAALDRLGTKATQVQALFITIDPVHDQPPVLLDYLSSFSARLIGLTGQPDDVRKVAREYRVSFERRVDAAGRSAGAFDHSSVLYLMAPDGHFVAPIPADASGAAMAQSIALGIR